VDRSPKLIRGVITTQDGKALAGATIELFNLTGISVAKSVTDSNGRFDIVTDAVAGEYELIIANSRQLNEEQIKLGRTDLSMKIVVTAATQDNLDQTRYKVSARQLGIPPKARARIAVAQDEFEKGHLRKAMNELEGAIEISPSCSEAWSMRAFMRLAAKNIPGAIDDGLHAVELDRTNAEAYLALGSAYNSTSDFDTAETHLRRSLEIRPNSWQAQLELAKTWYGQRKFVLALQELDLIERDFPDIHLVRANVLISLGRKPEGAGEFRTFLREVPGDRRTPQIQRILLEIARGDKSAPPETNSY
jgi:tetratricopeptide (TPR) repeat protein